jgi:hypothetical protein
MDFSKENKLIPVLEGAKDNVLKIPLFIYLWA